VAVLQTVVRRGAYYDSVTLLKVQLALRDMDGIEEAGVVMATPHNQQILADNGLLTPEARDAGPDDLVVVVRAVDEARAAEALGRLDELLARRVESSGVSTYRPKTLRSALRTQPGTNLALISVPGRYAAGLARECLDAGLSVFLFSDNVPLDQEIDLKRQAAEKGLLVMGPDCGTALVGGVGLGFANVVRRGPVGVVAASGTGLQEVSVLLHRYGTGVSHGLGTGGRDLSDAVGGASFRAALAALAADPGTEIIVLISKPPSPQVAAAVLADARAAGKPVVVHFLGEQRRGRQDNLHFAATLRETAAVAAALAGSRQAPERIQAGDVPQFRFAPGQRYLRGLYSGGTLCYEAVALLASRLGHPWTNTPLDAAYKMDGLGPSREDTLLDLGDDAFTVGRLHPMMDPEPRARRLVQEASDPETAVILLDVVLGYGAHADPASVLAPAVAEARSLARREGRDLAVVVSICGTDEDPQPAAAQAEALARAGALVQWSHEQAVLTALAVLEQAGRPVRLEEAAGAGEAGEAALPAGSGSGQAQAPQAFVQAMNGKIVAVNAGVGTFAEALAAQGVPVVDMDWRPPAAGDDRLRSLLDRLR